MIHHIAHILFFIVFLITAIDILYLLIAAVAGHLRKRKTYGTVADKKKIAVLITSYKEDKVIVHTAMKAAQHNYPPAYFDVYLAADQLKEKTINLLRRLNIHLNEVHFNTGSKARSLNSMLNSIDEKKYDIALVLDGDNIMGDGFLEKINAAFFSNFKAVQGHRVAKNKNTPVAVLDAVSEEINNHLFRKAQRAMGLSSTTIGSGMAFEFHKLKEVYNKPGILDNPACDREVDFEMMKENIIVEYIEDAYVLDEKVSKQKVYQNQRRRWLESQIIHLKLFFSTNEHVHNKTKNYWNKLFINLIPPRLIFIVLFIFILFIYYLQHEFHFNILYLPSIAWVILFAVFIISMLLSIPRKLYTRQTLRALLYLPVLLFSLLKATLSLKPGRKEFVHTPKSYRSE